MHTAKMQALILSVLLRLFVFCPVLRSAQMKNDGTAKDVITKQVAAGVPAQCQPTNM